MAKIRYQVVKAFRSPNTFCLNYPELRDRLFKESGDSFTYVSPTCDNQGHVYHFNGRCGGLTVNIIGVGGPRWVEIFGDEKGFNEPKSILEKFLESKLFEGVPV